MNPLDWLALILLVLLGAVALDIWLGLPRVRKLADVAPLPDGPRVSVLVPARNEERDIEPALRSLAAQHYGNLEIIVVDDRSTDRTGELVAGVAAGTSRIRHLRVGELPNGWLGKNHALAVGAEAATGDWLLFTDADVVFAPDGVARAVGFAEARGLDHLTVLPEMRMPGRFLGGFVVNFVLSGMAMLRPWKPVPPGSRRAVGVGAFNLVRAELYRRVGGHEPIRFRPDDDLQLAMLLNRAGARAELLLGRGVLEVIWYRSVAELVDGLMKNAFSIVDYRAGRMLGLTLLALGLGLAPPLAAGLGSGFVRWAGVAALALLALIHARCARVLGASLGAAALFPAAYLLMAWIELRALLLNLAQGGIVWRGTFYRLAELRRHRR